MHFSDMIKTKRKELGLTQSAFANRVGVSWITVWRWEKGHTEPNENAKVGVLSKLS